MKQESKPKTSGDKKVGAVLVVGSGIAGMQSSLDLANSGFQPLPSVEQWHNLIRHFQQMIALCASWLQSLLM